MTTDQNLRTLLVFGLTALLPSIALALPIGSASVYGYSIFLSTGAWLLAAILYSFRHRNVRTLRIWIFFPIACGPAFFMLLLAYGLKRHGI